MTKILVVEDEEDLREDIVEYLELEDFEVEQAVNGLDGLEKAVAYRPDVIISDISMPKLDGHGFFQRLHKEHPDIADVPFLFLTALTDREAELRGRSLGASDYLAKPIDLEILVATVRSHVLSADKANRKINRRLQSILSKISKEDVDVAGPNGEKIMDDLLDRYQSVIDEIAAPIGSIGAIDVASFRFKTLEEAKSAAMILSHACPDAEGSALGFVELFLNAVEHGNLGLTYADKSKLLASGEWFEEIEKRLGEDAYNGKQVKVKFERFADKITVDIIDEGAGFDWKKFMELDAERAMDLHGRGIAFANSISFSSIEYKGKGNEVTATIQLDKPDD
ncbi:MAG: response regulator [Kordiimonadaceae bacterium]|nr:response regulator [Kordiimonadaceae bacterium]